MKITAGALALLALVSACTVESKDAGEVVEVASAESTSETFLPPETTQTLKVANTIAIATTAVPTTYTAPPLTATTAPPRTTAAPTTTTAAPPSETPSQRNARRSAESYIKSIPFSRQGLIEQLQYEHFSTEDATYAVDNITVDWNVQAAKQAASYLESMAFSRQGLYDQLIYEGFTPEQAEYGVSTTGL